VKLPMPAREHHFLSSQINQNNIQALSLKKYGNVKKINLLE
jgi:hypothetical protein